MIKNALVTMTLLTLCFYGSNYGMIVDLPEELHSKVIEYTDTIPGIINGYSACKTFYKHIDTKDKKLNMLDRALQKNKWLALSMGDGAYKKMCNYFFDLPGASGYITINEQGRKIRNPYVQVQKASIAHLPIPEEHSDFINDMFLHFFGTAEKDKSLDPIKLNLLLCNPCISPGIQYCIYSGRSNFSSETIIFDYIAENKNTDSAKWILSHALFKCDYRFSDRKSALNRAVAMGNVEIVNYLLGLIANPNIFDVTGKTPLYEAAVCMENIEMVRVFLSHPSVDPNAMPIHMSAPVLYSLCNNDAVTLVEEFLLNKEVDPNIVNWYGYTPLHAAVRQNRFFIVKALLADARTNPDIPNKNGLTALEIAKSNEKNDILQLFLSRGDK